MPAEEQLIPGQGSADTTDSCTAHNECMTVDGQGRTFVEDHDALSYSQHLDLSNTHGTN